MDQRDHERALALTFRYFGSGLLLGMTLTLLLTSWFGVDAFDVFHVSTYNLRNLESIFNKADQIGIPLGMVIFGANLTTSLAIMALLPMAAWATPGLPTRWPRLRRMLVSCDQPDFPNRVMVSIAKASRRVVGPRPIHNSFQSHCGELFLFDVPRFLLCFIGLVLGSALASICLIAGTATCMAYVLPHGVIELPALCLAGSLTFWPWMMAREESDDRSVFRAATSVLKSSQYRKLVALQVLLVLTAGLIEGHATQDIANWFLG